MVQWLRLHASTAGGMGSISALGELRSCMLHGVAKKKKKKKEFVPGQMGSAGMTGCGWVSGSSGMPGRGSIC